MTAGTPLAPKLRFPEFCDAGEWQRYALGEIAEISKGKGISKSDVVEGGQTPCVRYGELYTLYGEIIEIVKSKTNLSASDLVLSKAGDVIIPASGETKEDIATCACVVDDGVALGGDLNVVRSPFDGRFFSYYLNGSQRRELAKFAQGDTVAHLYPTQLSRLEVYIPDEKAEQQRIADCLGSLDGLIAAEGRKLKTLRQHKQGLMQQLFPRPGETAPRLRFPEFRDAAEWDEKKLGEQGDFLSPLTGKTAQDFDRGDSWFIPYMNVFSNTFTNPRDLRAVDIASGESQNAVAKGDLFFTVSSETPQDAGMASVLMDELDKCYLNSFCALFRFDKEKLPNLVFLGYLLRSELARRHLSRGAQGATRYNISKSTFRSLPLQLPSPPEQQRIADCLGSLDGLIAAEGRKLEALRQHKQGLMQQFFPSLEEEAQ